MATTWGYKRLGELTDKIGSGATPRGGKESYKEIGVSLIRSLNIHDLEFRYANLAKIDDTQAAALANVDVEARDVLLNITGASIARCAQVPLDVLPARVNQHVAILRPKSNILDSRFLSYLLVAKETKEQLLNIGEKAGATRQALTKEQLQNFHIPLPPLDEQKRIVAVLDQAFAALDRARAHAEANLADADELFENVLLATFDELVSSAGMRTLAEAASDFSRGKSRHRPRNDPALYGGAYPFIQTGDIRRSQGSIREYSQTYNDVGLAQSMLWPVGTVCITIAANIAETGVLEFEGCFPDSVIGMVPTPGESTPYYVEYMLRYFAKELKLQGKGSAQDNINLATFEHAKFPFPPLERQMAVVEKLDSLAAEVAALCLNYSRTLEDIANLCQSLLQKAFSGQLA
ncbi:hypothetical protein B0E47_01770 [Rhodanobacter sp. B05]|nr:hypothetical protein B0E47_01770 [Rhodanobacter sp. B05]